MKRIKVLLPMLIVVTGLFVFCSCGDEEEATVEESTAPKYDVSIEIQCDENLFFNRYDVDVSIGYTPIGTVEHGATESFTRELEEGEYEIIFENEDDFEVDGKSKFTVQKDSKNEFAFRIHCNSDQIDVETIEKEPENTEVTTEEATTEKQTEATTKAKEKAKKGRIDEMAFRAAVVAMTNATAYDVFKEDDGNTHDPSKYHSYADKEGDCTWDVLSDGYWKTKGENKWHVKSLKMINEYDVVMTVSLDVEYDGTNYVISNVKGEMHKPGTDLEPTDLAIATDPHYVNNNTSLIVSKNLIDKDR